MVRNGPNFPRTDCSSIEAELNLGNGHSVAQPRIAERNAKGQREEKRGSKRLFSPQMNPARPSAATKEVSRGDAENAEKHTCRSPGEDSLIESVASRKQRSVSVSVSKALDAKSPRRRVAKSLSCRGSSLCDFAPWRRCVSPPRISMRVSSAVFSIGHPEIFLSPRSPRLRVIPFWSLSPAALITRANRFLKSRSCRGHGDVNATAK